MRLPFYGVESYYDRFLVSDSGIGFTEEPNATVADLPMAVRRFLPSLAGKDLVLTIDSSMQWIIEEELRNGLKEYKAERGTIIVMDSATGEILGMASQPSYDPNRYGNAESTSSWTRPSASSTSRARSSRSSPWGPRLDTSVITPTMTSTIPAMFTGGGRPIFNSQRDRLRRRHRAERPGTLAQCRHGAGGAAHGKSAFYDYVRRFGFGSATQVDLAGEIPGALKTPGTLDWSESDLATNSFGQGLAVTPLQMVNAVASIANGGKLMRPYVVKARTSQ